MGIGMLRRHREALPVKDEAERKPTPAPATQEQTFEAVVEESERRPKNKKSE